MPAGMDMGSQFQQFLQDLARSLLPVLNPTGPAPFPRHPGRLSGLTPGFPSPSSPPPFPSSLNPLGYFGRVTERRSVSREGQGREVSCESPAGQGTLWPVAAGKLFIFSFTPGSPRPGFPSAGCVLPSQSLCRYPAGAVGLGAAPHPGLGKWEPARSWKAAAGRALMGLQHPHRSSRFRLPTRCGHGRRAGGAELALAATRPPCPVPGTARSHPGARGALGGSGEREGWGVPDGSVALGERTQREEGKRQLHPQGDAPPARLWLLNPFIPCQQTGGHFPRDETDPGWC